MTSKVTSVVRDGIGGYIVKMDGRLQTTEFDARSTVHCHFGSASIISLSQIPPGREITIRGVVRKIADDTNHYVDPKVQVTIKNCDLIGE